jgi:hypothetical protein
VDCNNLTDVEKVVSKGIEGKKARREKLTEDDERMNRILTEKKSAAKRASVASVVKDERRCVETVSRSMRFFTKMWPSKLGNPI